MHDKSLVAAFILVLSTHAASSASWEGTWGRDSASCAKGLVDGGASFKLTTASLDAPGRHCDVKVERGRGDDDLIVETCRGPGQFMPGFDLVGVHDGRLYVTNPMLSGQRSYVRCDGSSAPTPVQPQVPNPFR